MRKLYCFCKENQINFFVARSFENLRVWMTRKLSDHFGMDRENYIFDNEAIVY